MITYDKVSDIYCIVDEFARTLIKQLKASFWTNLQDGPPTSSEVISIYFCSRSAASNVLIIIIFSMYNSI